MLKEFWEFSKNFESFWEIWEFSRNFEFLGDLRVFKEFWDFLTSFEIFQRILRVSKNFESFKEFWEFSNNVESFQRVLGVFREFYGSLKYLRELWEFWIFSEVFWVIRPSISNIKTEQKTSTSTGRHMVQWSGNFCKLLWGCCCWIFKMAVLLMFLLFYIDIGEHHLSIQWLGYRLPV